MPEINTFVFFDTETTELNTCGVSKITELAFTACLREHLLNANKNEIPRAVYKLLLPFNPQKVIHPDATRITGLDNFLLEYLNKMDGNTIDLINCFFNQLKKPVCLVAHNGNKFDYSILAQHLKKLSRSIDDDILCVDSLEIFKKYDENNTTSSAIEEFLNTDLVAVQNRNEKTPSKSHSFAVITRASGEKPKSAKCLFESPSTSTATPNGDVTSTPSQKTPNRISYKLEEIFKRLHNCPPKTAHNAEADTIHLLLCAIAVKNEFVELADSLATKFSKYK